MNNNFDMLRGMNQDGETIVQFARQDNGMIVGLVQGELGRFGEDPSTSICRAFTSNDHALKWVKDRCRDLVDRQDVEFFERSMERKLVTPAGADQRRM